MSDLIDIGFNIEKAIHYNERAAREVGWYGNIPEEAMKEFPGLRADALGEEKEQVAFAEAVYEMQVKLFSGHPDDHDGKLGGGTQKAMLMTYAYVNDEERHLIHNGARIALSDKGQKSALYTFEHPFGLSVIKGGWYRNSHRRIRFIQLHWGGIDAPQCKRVLVNRNLSSHFGIDRKAIYQWLDTGVVAYHGGKTNLHSIGIDICQQPTTKYHQRYRDRGYDCEIVDNPNRVYGDLKRGDKQIITLDSHIVVMVRELLSDLCEAFDVPLRVPRGSNGYADSGEFFHGVFPEKHMKDGKFRGIIGHHHSSKGKWDVAPWWDQIFAGWI